MEIATASLCHDCKATVDLTVNIIDHYDEYGHWEDVSVEVDMRPWHAHAATHRRIYGP